MTYIYSSVLIFLDHEYWKEKIERGCTCSQINSVGEF